MEKLENPPAGRIPIRHHVKNMRSGGRMGLDDEVHINTQTSSQWDSLRHWAIQDQGLFYNGVSIDEMLESVRNGIHNICERGGIVGRGVLMDCWKHHHSEEPSSPTSGHQITVKDIEADIAYQNTIYKQGDTLLVRTGFVTWYEAVPSIRNEIHNPNIPGSLGVSPTMETVRWLYSKRFAAVACDTIALEQRALVKTFYYMTGYFVTGGCQLENYGAWRD